jgi:hypothetical protein
MEKRLNISSIRALMILLLIFIEFTAYTQTLENLIVYVWDFSTLDGKKNKLTINLTNEFEEALIQSKQHLVLERRDYAGLISQKDNEKAILNIEGVTPTTVNNLKAHQANAVIFGKVYDDVESGQIKVTVIVQKFDGLKLTQQSIYLSRGLRYDAESRNKAMQELVNKIIKTLLPDSKATNSPKQESIENTLTSLAGYMKETPLSAAIYQDRLKVIVDSIQEKPEFEKQYPKLTAIAYRLYSASLIMQPEEKGSSPTKSLDFGYPWLKRSINLNVKFKDDEELKLTEIFIRKLLIDPPETVLMEDLLKHEFRVAMIESNDLEINAKVKNALELIMYVKANSNLNNQSIINKDGIQDDKGKLLEKKELAALKLGLSLGSKLVLVTLPINNRINPLSGIKYSNIEEKDFLQALGISDEDSNKSINDIQSVMKNPNNIMAASIILGEANRIKDFLNKQNTYNRYASIFRIGLTIGYLYENSLFVLSMNPTSTQLIQFETINQKWKTNLPMDIFIAQLPIELTAALKKTMIRVHATADLKAQIEACKYVVQIVRKKENSDIK